MSRVILIGQGKLARSVLNHFNNYSDLPLISYKPGMRVEGPSIFVHAGSGREYRDSLETAMDWGASYIQAATEKDYSLKPPMQLDIPFIQAPNLDLNIIKILYMLATAGDLFEGEKIRIMESHQKEKSSAPGTAMKFCEHLKIPASELISIRDPRTQQRELSILNTEQHAYHKIVIGDEHSCVSIETRVEGSLSYVRGLAKITGCIGGLSPGLYEVSDLVSLGYL